MDTEEMKGGYLRKHLLFILIMLTVTCAHEVKIRVINSIIPPISQWDLNTLSESFPVDIQLKLATSKGKIYQEKLIKSTIRPPGLSLEESFIVNAKNGEDFIIIKISAKDVLLIDEEFKWKIIDKCRKTEKEYEYICEISLSTQAKFSEPILKDFFTVRDEAKKVIKEGRVEDFCRYYDRLTDIYSKLKNRHGGLYVHLSSLQDDLEKNITTELNQALEMGNIDRTFKALDTISKVSCINLTDKTKKEVKEKYALVNRIIEGDKNIKEEKYELAVEVFRELYEKYPEIEILNLKLAEGLYGIGRKYYQEKKYEEAINVLKDAIVHSSAKSEYHYTLGLAYLRIGNYKEAISELEKSIGIEEKPEYLVALAQAYKDEEGCEKSIALLQKAMEYDKQLIKNFDVVVMLSECYRETGNAEEQEKYLKTAVNLNPNNHNVHRNLAELYNETGRWEDAIKEYKVAIKLNPNDYESLYRLAKLYYDGGNYKVASEYLKKAFAIQPGFQPAVELNELISIKELEGVIDIHRTVEKILTEFFKSCEYSNPVDIKICKKERDKFRKEIIGKLVLAGATEYIEYTSNFLENYLIKITDYDIQNHIIYFTLYHLAEKFYGESETMCGNNLSDGAYFITYNPDIIPTFESIDQINQQPFKKFSKKFQSDEEATEWKRGEFRVEYIVKIKKAFVVYRPPTLIEEFSIKGMKELNRLIGGKMNISNKVCVYGITGDIVGYRVYKLKENGEKEILLSYPEDYWIAVDAMEKREKEKEEKREEEWDYNDESF
jgi:tetratricopeptide (TPR) repeat protein